MLRRNDLLRFARAGAEARLLELRQEMDAIYAAFPDLRGGSRAKAAGVSRRRQSWSAAQRKAVSERMRKYWAARKGAKK